MEFISQNMLWGAFAVIIPIILHLFHKKKAVIISWAAMHWLGDSEPKKAKGYSFENLILLILRCLLVLLIVALLSEPILNLFKSQRLATKIHVVQPNEKLIENFKFELESAFNNNQKVVNLDNLEEIKKIEDLEKNAEYNAVELQNKLNKLSKFDKKQMVHLYVLANKSLTELPQISVPNQFKLHFLNDSSTISKRKYIKLINGKAIFVKDNSLQSGQLNVKENAQENALKPYFNVFINEANASAVKSIKASLNALSNIYGFVFKFSVGSEHYDIVFNSNNITSGLTTKNTLFVNSEQFHNSALNTYNLSDSFDMTESELAASGRLPEIIGDIILKHFKLHIPNNKLLNNQIRTHFIESPNSKNKKEYWEPKLFIILILLTLLAERWLSFRKNA